jgi:hypothetical protein
MVNSTLDTPNACRLYEDLKMLLLKERNEKLYKIHNIVKRAHHF